MATQRILVLDEDDVAILRTLIEERKHKRPPRSHRSWDVLWNRGEDQSAPEVYVAKPVGDEKTIPGITKATVGTGTGTGTGTGVSDCDVFDAPGSTDCYIYQIVESEECGPLIMQIEEHTETVYNVGEDEITVGDGYVPIERDKFGKWLAVSGKGGSAKHLRKGILLTDLQRGIGETCEIQELLYDYLGRLCLRGEVFTAHDPFGEKEGTANMTGCWFQVPSDDPLGRAEIVGVTCPLYEFNLDIVCSESWSS